MRPQVDTKSTRPQELPKMQMHTENTKHKVGETEMINEHLKKILKELLEQARDDVIEATELEERNDIMIHLERAVCNINVTLSLVETHV